MPPFEAGLRPNSHLDEADTLLAVATYEPDGVVGLGDGVYRFSAGQDLWELRGGSVSSVASFDGLAGSIEQLGDVTLVAVEGQGIKRVESTRDSTVETFCHAEEVRRCVTDLTVVDSGQVYITIGSRQYGVDQWAHALVDGDRTGELLCVEGTSVSLVSDGMGWPAGVCGASSGSLLVATSFDYTISTLNPETGEGEPIVSNLPFYPGRLRSSSGDGCWVAAPYVRNRGTELLLSEREFVAEMVRTIEPSGWLVPRLRSDRPHTDALQIGQLRVLGVLKPWAPPRSYGLVAHLAANGRFDFSAHSRVDATNHGVTDTTFDGSRLVVATRGGRNLLAVEAGTIS